METIKFEKLLLKTAFCCMASDGDIDPREVKTIETLCSKSEWFKDFNFKQEINHLIEAINTGGISFIQTFLDDLENVDLSEKEEIEILDFAIMTIYADEKVEYSEVKFFKTIRHRLNISDDSIRQSFPELDDNFIEVDIKTDTLLEDLTKQFVETAVIPEFDIIDFKTDNE